MNEKEELQWNETSNKLLDSKYYPPVPFPTALIPKLKPKKKPIEEEELMKLLEQVHINILLLDSIKHLPSYVKFLKSLCTPKKETRTINLSTEVSALISNTLPRKQKDPSSPLVSCSIGNLTFRKALLDLGASVNILPTHLFEQLKLGNWKLTSIVLSLGDKSLRYPRGMIEDVIVKVEGYSFLVDFHVLDMTSPENVNESTIILGGPFLATVEANIDCKTGVLVMSYGGERFPLKVFNEIKGFDDIEEQGNNEECHTITIEHDHSKIPRISSL